MLGPLAEFSKLLRESHHSRYIFSQHSADTSKTEKTKKKVHKTKLIQFHICILK
jgi:hypothetical protein